MQDEWRVPLPQNCVGAFEVYVNGVPQRANTDFELRGRELVFARPLAREGKLSRTRWASMLLGVAGTYGRNDSVDVVYEVGGRRVVASGLPILQPDPDPPGQGRRGART